MAAKAAPASASAQQRLAIRYGLLASVAGAITFVPAETGEFAAQVFPQPGQLVLQDFVGVARVTLVDKKEGLLEHYLQANIGGKRVAL